MVKLSLKQKLRASTLLEVLIAMVLMLIVFAIALGLYQQVLNSGTSMQVEQAKAITEKTVMEAATQQAVLAGERSWRIDSLLIKEEVLPYEDFIDLVLIKVTAYGIKGELAESSRVIKTDYLPN